MSEPRDAPRDEPRADIAAPGESEAVPPKPSAPSGWRAVAVLLAVVLLLVFALVGSAPLWAPALPWARAPARSEAPPDPRLDRLEAAQQQSQQQRQQDEAAANAALQVLDRRVGALEARPALPASDIADLRQQSAKLSTTAAELAARVAAIDKEVHAQGTASNELAARVEAIDKAVHSQAAADKTDTAVVLVLLQIRGAVAAGRPFAAEYEALAALARARPEIMAAAAPLAEPAKTGVAGRAVLANRLRELSGAIITAAALANAPENAGGKAGEGGPDWIDQVLSRLGGLVQIRRIGGASQGRQDGGPQAVVNAAELALAGGDLDGAVAALDKLTGPPADAAGPWLRMARERLAVEAALHGIEALAVARLGAPANSAAAPGLPR